MMMEEYREYFEESDADKRKIILDAMEESLGETKPFLLCRVLWQLRYVDPKKGNRVDLFLWELLELLCLYSTSRHMKKAAVRDTKKALDALGVYVAREYGQDGEEMLYWELRNAVRLYLHTCDSKGYHRKLFGFMELKEPEWQRKVSRDIWRLSEGLPGRLEMKEDFMVLSRAARDEFIRQFENGEALLQEREEECGRGKNKKQ